MGFFQLDFFFNSELEFKFRADLIKQSVPLHNKIAAKTIKINTTLSIVPALLHICVLE